MPVMRVVGHCHIRPFGLPPATRLERQLERRKQPTDLILVAEFIPGLACAWLMTFFDTVDGKLARVTATSSKFGDILDHGIDIIHPPIWWFCLAWGLNSAIPGQGWALAMAAAIVLGTYVVGRVIEIGFKRRYRINPYTWRPFDSRFRTIVARRNIILLIFTFGLALGNPAGAFLSAAGWCIVSTIVQGACLWHANAIGESNPIVSWMS